MADTADITSMPAGQALLTVADLNLHVNHEARVLDLRLAEALGFERPRKVRELIARHIEALERLGSVCPTAGQTAPQGGRPGKSFWLNKRQCLFICTKAETPNATEATIAMVEVFDEHLRGTLAKPVRVRPHRRALPARHPDLEPGKFEPGSDLVLDVVSALMSANLRVERGEARDFGSALQAVFEDVDRRRRDPACAAGGQLLDHNHARASQALAAKLRARGVETKPLVRAAAERAH